MSASASNSPSRSTTCGSSYKRKRSEEVDIQRKRPSTTSPPQYVDRCIEEVRDTQSREAGDGGDPGISIDSPLPSRVPPFMDRGNGNAQSGEAGGGVDPDLTTPPETPTVAIITPSSNVAIIQFGDAQFTEVQRDLIGDYITTLTALPNINHNSMKHVLTQFTILLPRAEAVFDDYQTMKKSGPCAEGTRAALLREMANWFTGEDKSGMYILSGLAGIGKSAVAFTIASRAADLNLLGASFFFSRDEADRNNAKRFFTTIAYQLCVHNEHFAKAIGDALLTERGSAATTKGPQEQLQVLILDPLRSIVQSRVRPILVVVDALDECCKDDVRAVVEGLSQLVRELPSFKVILTTRPLPYLDYFLVNQGDHKLFHMHDIEDDVVDGDIRIYLTYNLSLEKVREFYPRRQWCASDEQIDTLVRAAGRLFIIASMAVQYILDKSASNPAAQMQELLCTCARDHTLFQDLDDFYTTILRNVVPANCANQTIVSRYQSVVSAIIFASRPLPVSTLAHLIDMDVEDVHAVLEKLQSVILIGDDDIPRIYHKSFSDYLMDQERCKDFRLQIIPRIHHTDIATCCFEIMNKHLKYNILDLGVPARFMSNEDGLKKDKVTGEQLQEKMPQQLRYACVYWASHLEVANIEDINLMNGLETFVDEHMLHWFEVLSLIGILDLAHRAIRVVLKLLKSTSSGLHQLLSDALRFISKFYETIERSALHTYYSALPFSPTDSFLYRRYIEEVEHNICGVEGEPKKWDALVAKLDHGEGVDVIKFSLEGDLFVSCSEESGSVDSFNRKEGKLKIWDATTSTGPPISSIQGHRFAFTNDFSTVASSSDNIITYYNMDGSTRGPVLTAPSKIQNLVLSESSRVAAALSDGTIWLWDSGSGELIDRVDGFGGRGQLEFSRTGTRLAYSSADGIVKLHDGISGTFIANLQRFLALPCGSRHSFVFSDDGSRIASFSYDSGLQSSLSLWNSESGKQIAAIWNFGRGVVATAISANGSRLATADYHDNVTLWRESCGNLAKIEILQAIYARSMAFSLDNLNILAIATDYDIKLYSTNTLSFISTLSCSGLSAPLAFSPGCTHLAGGSGSGNLYLWDMRGIDYSNPPSKKATTVTAMALSRDCSRLACGFSDNTVELWETSPTTRRLTSHKGHWVSAVGFAPDGRLFASGSDDGTIKLWNARDGSLHGTLEASPGFRNLQAVALSKNMLVAVWDGGVTLWNLNTLNVIHTAQKSSCLAAFTVSISDESDLIAIALDGNAVFLFDVVNRTNITKFTVPFTVRKLTFLNKSRLVIRSDNGNFLSFNLILKRFTSVPTLEDLIRLPDTPLWRGVPVWHCWANRQHYFSALFSQNQPPVPVLWIPSDIRVNTWTQGSSMIALGCRDGRIILLRLPTGSVG